MTNVGDLSNAFETGNYMDRESIPIRSNVTGLRVWLEQFSGRVYDGPWEGKMHTERGRDYFYMNIAEPVRLPLLGPMVVPDTLRVYRGMYRWSYPLHAWVFDWRTIA